MDEDTYVSRLEGSDREDNSLVVAPTVTEGGEKDTGGDGPTAQPEGDGEPLDLDVRDPIVHLHGNDGKEEEFANDGKNAQDETEVEPTVFTPPRVVTDNKTSDHLATPRFDFLSDKKHVPSDMKKLQDRTIRRRREHQVRMHGLECRLASTTSKYTEKRR